MSEKKILEISDTTNNFESEVTDSSDLVLVKFGAPWCRPCKMLDPILTEIHQEMSDKFKLVSINIDDSPNISSKYNIVTIPTLILFKNKTIQDKKNGYLEKEALEEWINSNI